MAARNAIGICRGSLRWGRKEGVRSPVGSARCSKASEGDMRDDTRGRGDEAGARCGWLHSDLVPWGERGLVRGSSQRCEAGEYPRGIQAYSVITSVLSMRAWSAAAMRFFVYDVMMAVPGSSCRNAFSARSKLPAATNMTLVCLLPDPTFRAASFFAGVATHDDDGLWRLTDDVFLESTVSVAWCWSDEIN